MKKKLWMRLLAAVLSCLFLTAGCSQVPAEETWALQETFDPLDDPIFDVLAEALSSNKSVPLQNTDRDGLVPFPEMVYQRPNADAMTAELYRIAQAVRESVDSPGAAVLLLKEAGEIWDNFLTALNLALIHHDINTRDAYWADEYAYCAGAEGALRLALAYVQGSAAYVQGEAATSASSLDQEQYLALQEQEQALLNEYSDILNNAYTIYNDEMIYFNDDISYEAATAWLEVFAPRLSEIYAELVRVRNGIARCFGYANYAEYTFSDTSYSASMVSTLLDALATYYAPLNREELEQYRDPDLRIEVTQAVSFMRTIFAQLDPQLLESLDLMEAYQLSSLAESPEKASGAFTSFIADYGVPFICMRYDGTYSSFATLLHEFGHFNDLYRNEEALYETPEVSEIFSTALVLLASDRYSLVMDEQSAALCKYREIDEVFLSSLEQGALLRLEMQAYTLPEESLTMDTLCSLAENAWNEMGFAPTPMSRLSWLQTPHLFETPFYVLSYVVSGSIAMQIWELDGGRADAGFAKYNELLQAAQQKDSDFLEIVEGCGLSSPFSVAETARMAEVFAAQLAAVPDGMFGVPAEQPEAAPAEEAPQTLPAQDQQPAAEPAVLPDAVEVPA